MEPRRRESDTPGTRAQRREQQGSACWVFAGFRLDQHDEQLWRGEAVVHLHPKTLAVLGCLVTQAGQLVTKDALLAEVWPETVLSESVVTVAIRQLRRALEDQARASRFIETVHGRGYRFVAPVSATIPPERPTMAGKPHRPLPPAVGSSPLFVGRDADLAQLARWWTTAQQGQRQVGMIIGEPGIGKTALVEAFVAQACTAEPILVGRGQCVHRYGVGEAYLPILEALGRLCKDPEGAPLISVLRQYAPSWIIHLPAVLASENQERIEPMAGGVTPNRMLRELAEALEVLTVIRPLLLVLEDLHWSDGATLEWLAYVVRRRDPARLLILGTYRPVEAIVHAHPLRSMVAEIRHHPQYTELALDYLSAAATAAYVQQRCGAQHIPAGLPQLLHQRTGGNPLFLVAMVDELVRRGLLETAGDAGGSHGVLSVLRAMIPTSLRQYIEQHIEQLTETDQTLLEAASVAGSTFTVAAVAAGVGQAPEMLEERYTAFARHGQFIQASGTETWPDGTVTACYQFIHALYHEVVYARVSAGHRVRLHQQIGACKEAGYGEQAADMAAELAMHFERGRDARRALAYLRQAADKARQRYAHAEAIQYLRRGLAVLETLPGTTEPAAQELALQAALGPALMAIKGYAAPEVVHAYARAYELCQQVGDTPQRFDVLRGLCLFYQEKAALQTAHSLAEQLVHLAQRLHDPICLLWAHDMLEYTLFYMGELGQAQAHLEESLALYMTHTPRADGFVLDPGVDALCALVEIRYLLGYPDQALTRSREALALARDLAHPFSVAQALSFAVGLHRWRGEQSEAQALEEANLALCHEQGFAQELAEEMFWHGSDLVKQGQVEAGIVQMRQGLEASRDTGAEARRPWLLTALARAYGKAGQVEAGLTVLDEALSIVETTGKRLDEAGLHRCRGELLMQYSRRHQITNPRQQCMEAEACFQQALAVARRQQARSFELRAAMNLARLWQQQSKRTAARELLAPVYGWFTEGLGTADLQEARALLTELER